MSEKLYFFEFCNGEIMEYEEFNKLEEVKEYITKNHICSDEIQVFKGKDITDELVKDIEEWRKPTKTNHNEREEELAKVKDIMKDNIEDADAGMFFTRNLVGDPMETIFTGVYFTLDICRSWGYFELFGANTLERQEIEECYDELKERWLKE